MSHYAVKQVIIVRRDLRNTKGERIRGGKLGAQVAHASMMWLGNRFRDSPRVNGGRIVSLTAAEEDWLVNKDFAKIVLGVDSEAELQELVEKARAFGFATEVCIDNGTTEFGGVKTATCAAIGPAVSTEIDKITGHLRPL